MNVWAVVMGSAAALIFIAIMVMARITFKPHHARNVKYAESIAESMAVQRHIVLARAAYPEIVKGDRLDWHPYFVLPHIGVFCYAMCMFAGAKLTNNVAVLGDSARYTMAACFAVGASMVLSSALLGARIGNRTIKPSIRDHITSDAVGDDIVMPYRLSMAGQFAVSVSMFIYSVTSFKTTTGSLGGWLTASLAVACVILAPMMYHRVRRFQRWDNTLIRDALADLERERNGD